MDDHIASIEAILRAWLEMPDYTVFSGDWRDGAVMELLPGSARLSEPRYGGRFAGIRDLRIGDGAHHVHLDLGRLSRARYLIAPSVCYGFKPSFELRLTADGNDPMSRFGIGFAVRAPYDGPSIREEVVRRYLQRVADHLRVYPEVTSFACVRDVSSDTGAEGWAAIERIVGAEARLSPLRASLDMPGAS